MWDAGVKGLAISEQKIYGGSRVGCIGVDYLWGRSEGLGMFGEDSFLVGGNGEDNLDKLLLYNQGYKYNIILLSYQFNC